MAGHRGTCALTTDGITHPFLPTLSPNLRTSILLVDDNAANLLALRAILEELDQDLVEARSGAEALERLQNDDYAVVLLDVWMPGMDGFDTAKHIRAQDKTRHTPIIFVTSGDIEREQIEAGYALGAVDFLIKPLSPIVLQAKVRGFVELVQEKMRARQEAAQLRLLVQGTTEYAIFMLDPQGRVVTWNSGAQRLKLYRAEEIIGEHFSRFYPAEAIARNWPQYELEMARREGRFEDEGWRVRKDGTQFWANVMITALRDEAGHLLGFSKVTRDMSDRKRAEEDARRLLEETTARRMAEENARAIQEQRERLHVTLASIGDAVVSTDAEGRVDFLNPVAQRLVGWQAADAQGRPLDEIFHIVNEVTRAHVASPSAEALRHGVVVGLANGTILIAKDGTETPIDDSAAPIRDAAGNVVGSVLVFRDISDRKRSQEALRESEARFRGLMEQAPFSIQVFFPDGRTKRVNRAWQELWGLTLAAIQDYNVLADRQLEATGVLPYLRRAFAGEPVSIPAILYDPSAAIPGRAPDPQAVRWVSAVAYPLKDESGQVQEVVLVHQDITSRKRAEEERERFAFLVQNSRDFIGMCDLELVPFFVNREGLRLIGLDSLQQLQQTGLQDFFFPEDRKFVIERFLPQVLREGHGEVEIRFRHFRTGEPIWFAYSVVTIRDAEGKPQGFATISRDISRLKEMNLALRQSDRRKDEFLALLAHELRNPLAPLRNGLQILRLAEGDPAALAQTREIMERQLAHMVRLIDDLLDVSRINRNKMELRRSRLVLADIINSAVETARPLISEAGHELTISLPGEPLHLDADLTRLAQVFANLLTNSAKYTPRGGKIRLYAEREANQVSVAITDNGIGIPRESLPTIFDMFSQVDRSIERSTGGLGIGLALVKGLVEMHGGSVQATSAGEGQGSTFTVRLPLVENFEPKALNNAASPAGFTGPRRRVLVVDDNQDAAISMATMLRLIGNEVTVAHDGLEALEAASQFRPQLILMDLGMPRLNGFDATRRIREQFWARDTVIIALTGWGKDEDRHKTNAAGCDGHLVKPVLLSDLEGLLATLD